MNKIFIILATLAVFSAHVARGDDASANKTEEAAPAAAAPEKSDTCTSDRGSFQPGDRYCASKTTHRVCNWGGQWIDGECPGDYSCEENKELKQVLCRKIVKNVPWPEAPKDADKAEPQKPSRARRDASETASAAAPAVAPTGSEEKPCTSDRGTFQHGERYCASESTSRVCSFGQWTDFQCDEGSTCLENKDLKQVLCRKIVKNTDSGSQNSETQNDVQSKPSRARRDIAPAEKTCTSSRGTHRHGERICDGTSTNRVCAFGEWTNFQCPPGSECLEDPASKGVLCREYHRNRRDAPAETSEEKSCSSDQGTFQHGDRYCSSETTSRVCSFGQWYDHECPANFKCKENKALKQVLCREIVKNAPWPTGPKGSDNAEPQPAPAQPAQPAQAQPAQVQPAQPAQAQPAQPAQPSQAQPAQPEAPAQPQPQPQAQAPSQPQAAPESAPAAPAQEDKLCPGGLQEGDQVCNGETGYKRCSNGQLLEDKCDPNAKCVAATSGNRVICREIRRNAASQDQQQQQQQQRR